MPRIDGYPTADPLTGSEVLPGMQGGVTKSITMDQLVARMQSILQPVIAQMIANAMPGGSSADTTTTALSDSVGTLLADDAGAPLLAI